MSFTYDYPRPAVTVDCVVLANDFHDFSVRHVLLIQRGDDPFRGAWALPGGFLNIDEATDVGAARELVEETGLAIPHGSLRQLGAFGDPTRDPRGRVISIAYLATVPEPCGVAAGDDARAASWFLVDELPDLAFDHALIIQQALRFRSR